MPAAETPRDGPIQYGFVSVDYLIAQDKRVWGVRVLASNPPGVYETAVLDALDTWRIASLPPYQKVDYSCRYRTHFDFCFDRCPGNVDFPKGDLVIHLGDLGSWQIPEVKSDEQPDN